MRLKDLKTCCQSIITLPGDTILKCEMYFIQPRGCRRYSSSCHQVAFTSLQKFQHMKFICCPRSMRLSPTKTTSSQVTTEISSSSSLRCKFHFGIYRGKTLLRDWHSSKAYVLFSIVSLYLRYQSIFEPCYFHVNVIANYAHLHAL